MSATETASHTPGPWKVDGADITDSRGIPVALRWADDGPVRADMNGHLIAAAPDLLAELEGIASYCEAFAAYDKNGQPVNVAGELQLRCRRAIAKARGER